METEVEINDLQGSLPAQAILESMVRKKEVDSQELLK